MYSTTNFTTTQLDIGYGHDRRVPKTVNKTCRKRSDFRRNVE